MLSCPDIAGSTPRSSAPTGAGDRLGLPDRVHSNCILHDLVSGHVRDLRFPWVLVLDYILL